MPPNGFSSEASRAFDLQLVFQRFPQEAVMYANIVVAVDGSEAAKRALSEAVQLAKLSRGKLTAVYVLDQSAAVSTTPS